MVKMFLSKKHFTLGASLHLTRWLDIVIAVDGERALVQGFLI